MSAVAEHFNSIDAKLETARQAWLAEKKVLEDQLLAAQLELKLTKEALEKAVEARSNAERMAAKLVAQFGVVSQVFEEAKELALEAGLYTKHTEVEKPGVTEAKAAIDEAVGRTAAALTVLGDGTIST